MIEICLKNKIIYNFLQNYKKKKWNNIIPSLLEIAILNIYNSFKRYIFSEEDLSLILENLKLKYNLPQLSIGNNMKSKQKLNINKSENEANDINISKLSKNLKHHYFNERKESYRSYTNKAKNINELNIYNINENKKIHYYNNSSKISPRKKLINYNETEISLGENRYKNIFKITMPNRRLIKSNYNSINKKNRILDYYMLDNSDPANNTYQNISNLYKNNHQHINYSFSIDLNKKNYIKVNKNNSNKKIIGNNKKIIEKEYLMEKNNYYYTNKLNEKNGKINKIKNKTIKYNIINNLNKKIKNKFNLFTNFNQKANPIISIQDENKNSFNLNQANYQEKMNQKNIPKKINNSLFHNSPKRKYTEFKVLTKLQNYNNSIIKSAQTSVNKNNSKEIKSVQFANIKKNIKNINLRNLLNKERRTDISREINDDINNTIANVNDISYSRYSNNLFKKGQSIVNSNNIRKKIINYNSFNKNKNEKKAVFLNDPLSFKNSRTKKLLLGTKINKINLNGKDNNL